MTEFTNLIEHAPQVVLRKLEQLKFLRENPKYHPEHNVYDHIIVVTDRLNTIKSFSNFPVNDHSAMVLAAIMHDICKFDVVKVNLNDGYPTCPNHEKEAYDLMDKLWGTSTYQYWCTQLGVKDNLSHTRAMNIVLNHMAIKTLGEYRPKKRDALMAKWVTLGIYHDLLVFGAADNMLVEFNCDDIYPSLKFDTSILL